jgi:hypothetical protein
VEENMGYSTDFDGELRFNQELKPEQLAYMESLFWESTRDREEWDRFTDKYGGYIQFELTRCRTGIKWDGSEKFYDAVGAVNVLTYEMRKISPGFRFVGQMLAQGEDIKDRWILALDNKGIAYRAEARDRMDDHDQMRADLRECIDFMRRAHKIMVELDWDCIWDDYYEWRDILELMENIRRTDMLMTALWIFGVLAGYVLARLVYWGRRIRVEKINRGGLPWV